MLSVIFEAAFIEDAVFRFVAEKEKNSGPDTLDSFYSERNQIYELASAAERDKSFQKFYEKMFLNLGLRGLFDDIFSEFRLLDQPQLVIYVRRVYSKKDEGADLFRDGELLNVLLTIQPMRVANQEYLKAFLRHEIMHICDMLDPAFRYNPSLELNALNDTEENLIRERFRILWAMFIDVRTALNGLTPLWSVEKHRRDFDRAFQFWSEDERSIVLNRLTSGELFTHKELLEWSMDRRLTKHLGEGGLLCPICLLPSFTAADKDVSYFPEVVKYIKEDRPDWELKMGICAQCFDLYSSRMKVA